ncbi:hypothetical protein PHET_09528 [Paragonimus heterotremus]|uniref:Uncharacterized protein n=1 Tax=Paragonimus heterotremus TaxID=100268 RepID=A0A8J4T4J7_9TREM|nr:hypothetical protein PHET_09528 [Paragonimus heterotremus]
MPSEKPYDEAIEVQDSEDIVTPRPQNSSQRAMEDFEDRQLKSKKKLTQPTNVQLAGSPSVSVIRKLFLSMHICIYANTMLFFLCTRRILCQT